jgi:hypothetical protein
MVDRAEVVAARAVGVGVGLIVLMLVWLVGNRLAGLVWEPPVGPTVAFAGAIVIGFTTGVIAGRRLVARLRDGG